MNFDLWEGCNVRLEERAREFFLYGEANFLKGNQSESKYENALVIWIRPEARWSIYGQAEVFRKEDGGLNRCCGHALEWPVNRGEKLI